jgi:hypothetical protein
MDVRHVVIVYHSRQLMGNSKDQYPEIPLERGKQHPNPLIVPHTLGDYKKMGDTPKPLAGENSPAPLSQLLVIPEKAGIQRATHKSSLRF